MVSNCLTHKHVTKLNLESIIVFNKKRICTFFEKMNKRLLYIYRYPNGNVFLYYFSNPLNPKNLII